MRSRIKKIIALIIVDMISILLITMFLPIKFCVSTFPMDSEEEFYIIRYSRNVNRWLVIGDRTGLFDENLTLKNIARSEKKRFEFSKEISVDLFMQGDATDFIVYGTATRNYIFDNRYGDITECICYTINETGWDILGEIKTNNWLRSIFPKKYLNIYDYRWFDVLGDRLYYKLDGQTYF